MSRAWRLWPLVALFVTILVLPFTAPFFGRLFPDLTHPLYVRASFCTLLLAHLELVAGSSLVAATTAILAGVFVTRPLGVGFRPLADTLAATGQTFPPIAVLALAIPVLGYGAAPTLAALTLYSVMPILQATIIGLESVPPTVRDAAVGIGFSPAKCLAAVEMPLAWPFIASGLRNAIIINIGTATIGSSVGALSLGSPIIEGLSASNPAYVIQGAWVVALLALSVESVFDVAASGRNEV
jgi:osmoprotectant transport system permease protein